MKSSFTDIFSKVIILSVFVFIVCALIFTDADKSDDILNFCENKSAGAVHVLKLYDTRNHNKILSDFQKNNPVEIISITQDDDVYSYHVKCN